MHSYMDNNFMFETGFKTVLNQLSVSSYYQKALSIKLQNSKCFMVVFSRIALGEILVTF